MCDGDGAAAGNCQGGGVDGTAGETRVGAVEGVVDGALGGREGDGVGAAAGWAADRPRGELGVEPCGALGEPVADDVHFIAEGGGGACVGAVARGGGGPFGVVADGGFGELGFELSDEAGEAGGSQGGVAECEPAVGVALPEVGFGPEVFPPAPCEDVGGWLGGAPAGGVGAAGVGGADGAVEVPDGACEELAVPGFVHVGAEAEAVGVLGEDVEQAVIDP